MDVAPTWMQALDKMMGGYPSIQRLWDVLGAERDIKLGVLKIAPERLKALQLVVPPMTLVQRAVPSDPVTEQYYAERGRLYDQWLTGQLSNWLGVKFILPAVEGEKRARLIKESDRLRAARKKSGYKFPRWKGRETPEHYKYRYMRGGI